jgi:hypothetical protein
LFPLRANFAASSFEDERNIRTSLWLLGSVIPISLEHSLERPPCAL